MWRRRLWIGRPHRASGNCRALFLLLAVWLALPAAPCLAGQPCGNEVANTFKRAAHEFAPVLDDLDTRVQRLESQGDSRDIDARLREIRKLQQESLPLRERRNRVLDVMLCTTICPCEREDVPTFVNRYNEWVHQAGQPRYGFHPIVLPSPDQPTANASSAPPAASPPLPDPNFVRARPRAAHTATNGQR